MHSGKYVFAQVMDHLPLTTFRRCVSRHGGDRKVQSFTCHDQFHCMVFAQLAYRESLRDIEACLRAQQSKLYHMGIRANVSRNTLANANAVRDWRIYRDVAQSLVAIARELYVNEPFGVDIDNVVYALDSTTIDLCLSVFSWAPFQPTKAAVKLHTMIDLRGSIPAFVSISDGKLHDVNVLDQLAPEPGAFYIMDRAYLDFQRLFRMTHAGSFFVIRAKSNTQMKRLCSRTVDRSVGLISDQTVMLTGTHTPRYYPAALRRIHFRDPETGKDLIFLTNAFDLQAIEIADLYRCRWKIELFFKWIKQHLRIKAFFGTSENAVKTQIWIALSTYLLVAILRKRLGLDSSLHQLLQVLSLTLFEKTPINQLISAHPLAEENGGSRKQLNLFD